MTESHDEFLKLVDHVAELVDEIKLMSLNLTIAHARLRLNDNAFQVVGRNFQQLLDTAAAGVEEAAVTLKKARGEKLTEDELTQNQSDLEASLDRVKSEAEQIINTVLAIKKSQRINRQV